MSSKRISQSLLITLSFGSVATVAAGCYDQPDFPAEPPELARGEIVTSPVVNWRDFWDPSGTVQVRTFQCDWTAARSPNTAYCAITDDFVLVGGGAETRDAALPGAMLTGSFPGSDFKTWIAQSKDHVAPYKHQLRAYAIGIKLQGVSADQLRSQMYIRNTVDGPSERPSASATVNSGDLMVGGGATTNWTQGQLLTSSRPLSPTTWSATSKDHGVVDYGSVFAYVIGMPRCPSGFGGCLVQGAWCSATDYAGTGYAAAATGRWDAMTTIGGLSLSNPGAPGRLLTHLVPNFIQEDWNWSSQFSFVMAKDHLYVDGGYLGDCAVMVRRE